MDEPKRKFTIFYLTRGLDLHQNILECFTVGYDFLSYSCYISSTIPFLEFKIGHRVTD